MVRTHQGSPLVQRFRLSGLSLLFFQSDIQLAQAARFNAQSRVTGLHLRAYFRHACAYLRNQCNRCDLTSYAPPRLTSAPACAIRPSGCRAADLVECARTPCTRGPSSSNACSCIYRMPPFGMQPCQYAMPLQKRATPKRRSLYG